MIPGVSYFGATASLFPVRLTDEFVYNYVLSLTLGLVVVLTLQHKRPVGVSCELERVVRLEEKKKK